MYCLIKQGYWKQSCYLIMSRTHKHTWHAYEQRTNDRLCRVSSSKNFVFTPPAMTLNSSFFVRQTTSRITISNFLSRKKYGINCAKTTLTSLSLVLTYWAEQQDSRHYYPSNAHHAERVLQSVRALSAVLERALSSAGCLITGFRISGSMDAKGGHGAAISMAEGSQSLMRLSLFLLPQADAKQSSGISHRGCQAYFRRP